MNSLENYFGRVSWTKCLVGKDFSLRNSRRKERVSVARSLFCLSRNFERCSLENVCVRPFILRTEQCRCLAGSPISAEFLENRESKCFNNREQFLEYFYYLSLVGSDLLVYFISPRQDSRHFLHTVTAWIQAFLLRHQIPCSSHSAATGVVLRLKLNER